MKTIHKICERLQHRGMNIRLPQTFKVVDGEELVILANNLPGLQEGFVVRHNSTGGRLKIKSSVYVAVHHLRGNGIPSMTKLMELVLQNEQAELLAYFPEFLQYVTPIELALATLLADADELYRINSHIDSQKEFALAVKDSPLSGLMFKTRSGKITPRHAFDQLDTNVKLKILEKFVGKSFLEI